MYPSVVRLHLWNTLLVYPFFQGELLISYEYFLNI